MITNPPSHDEIIWNYFNQHTPPEHTKILITADSEDWQLPAVAGPPGYFTLNGSTQELQAYNWLLWTSPPTPQDTP